MHLARSETEPDSSGWVLITSAGPFNWNSFGPFTKVPDALLEVNGSKISESNPQPALVSTGDNCVYPVWRSSAFWYRKGFKVRATLTPDAGSATPPDVTV